jgi:hypothetical protein
MIRLKRKRNDLIHNHLSLRVLHNLQCLLLEEESRNLNKKALSPPLHLVLVAPMLQQQQVVDPLLCEGSQSNVS